MEFRVLGPVEVWSEGVRVAIGGRQPRLLLAVLVLEADRPVPADRLVDLIWAQSPPPSARATVQAMVSRLRATFRQIGASAQLLSERGAYRLHTDPATVDAHRFSALVQQAAGSSDDLTTVELLDQALDLWRGEPLLDVVDDSGRQLLCSGLIEARWTAAEDRADALLRLGRTRRVVREVSDQVAGQPYRHRLVGQLMTALHLEGQADRASEVYRNLRTRLHDDLGLEPSRELSRLHRLILRGDPVLPAERDDALSSVSRRPEELPQDVPGFIGRTDEMARLDQLSGGSSATTVWVLSGIPGVGKTALAVRWAHRVRDAFPDGQMFIDLRGFDVERPPVTPSAALGQLLGGLGVDPRVVPDDQDGRVSLFRSTMTGRRILLVLDNARDADQVIPLIPPNGTVLITSRRRLGELVVRAGARSLLLGVLSPRDSVRLLAAMLGDEAVRVEAGAAARLAHLCGHLPLALRIAAANLQTSGHPHIAGLAEELDEGGPLTSLTVDGADEGAVTKAFAMSYRALPTAQQRMFRHLGLVPGGSFTAHVAAALEGVTPPIATRTLRALASAHLIEHQGGDRYRFHDLLRQYAVDRLVTEDDDTTRHDARQRLLEHYRSRADAAGRQLIPHFLRLPGPVPQQSFPDADEASAWLDAEAANVIAAINHAADHGHARFVWQLADALRAWFHQRGRRAEWLSAATGGLAAAQAADDLTAQASMHLSIALAHVTAGRYEEARHHLLDGLRINAHDRWPEGRTALLNNLSAVHQRLGNPRAAIDCAQRSLELNRQYRNEGGEAMSLANLGFAHWQLGALSQADQHIRDALACAERSGSRYNEAVLLVDLAGIRRDRGDREAAEELYDRALVANRDLGYQYGEATALSGRALLWSMTDRAPRACADARHAVALTQEIGDAGTEAWAREAYGRVLLAAERPAEAAEEHRLALDLARQTRFVWCEASALVGLAAVYLATEQPDIAREHAKAALRMANEAGYRLIESRTLGLLKTLDD
ncbi:BTAD domain-containing putative transcriptional regulator [Micromonospora tulbaghiae]|uniref:AfsR/SARP family transcriptional regulator n=1 Tax=Micromonospora tulbaghiae TaxID=479978 RepID=UPI00366713DA